MPKQPVTQPAPRDHEWAQAVDPGDIQTPSNGLVDAGYDGLDIPDHRDFNGKFRDWDQAMRCWLQRSVANWHASEEYEAGDVVRYNGVFYVAVAPAVGVNPAANETLPARTWERWGHRAFGTDESATTATAIQQWRNAKGVEASEIDRLGFFGGPRVREWLETWRGGESSFVTGATGLTDTDRTWGAGITSAGSDSGYDINLPAHPHLYRCAALTIGTGASDEVRMLGDRETYFHVDSECAMEFVLKTGANVDLMRVAVGWAKAEYYGAANTLIGALLAKGNGDANFQAITGDGSARTTVDTGVVVAANTDYYCRLEWIGSSIARDATSQMRFYINGTRTSAMRIITNLPSAAGTGDRDVIPSLALKRDTGAAARGVKIGPVRFSSRF